MGSNDGNLREQADNAPTADILVQIQKSIEKLERKEVKYVFSDNIEQTLITVQQCVSTIKLQLTELRVEQASLVENRKDRTMNCDKIHSDHEQRLRDQPSGIQCTANEKRLKTMEGKVDTFTPLLYKIVGGVIIVSLFIPPAVSVVFALILKKFSE